MEALEDYSYWATTEGPSTLPLPPFHMLSTEGIDLPQYQLPYGLHTSGVFQPIVKETDIPSQPISPLSLSEDSDFKGDWSEMIRHNFQPASAKSRPAGSGRDAVSPTVSEGSGLSSDNSQSNTRDEGQKTAKRRTQNRAAQRRFRERRDEQNKVLQEKAAELQAKYDALEEKYNLKTEQASQLQSENEGLQTEIQNLKQRWRTMILLLQRPQSLQFLSVLVGSEQAGLPPVDDLDGHLRCLDALLIPESKNT